MHPILPTLDDREVERALAFAHEPPPPTPAEKLRAARAAFAHWRRRHRWAALELSQDNLSRLGFTVRECTASADPAVRARVRARNEELRLLQGTGVALPVVQNSAPRQTAARPRGGGRPARRAGASSSTSSADPGDGESDGESEPPPPRGPAHGVALVWLHGGAEQVSE